MIPVKMGKHNSHLLLESPLLEEYLQSARAEFNKTAFATTIFVILAAGLRTGNPFGMLRFGGYDGLNSHYVSSP